MGTRGGVGFRINGVDKVTYNHYDSYPECLGKNVLEFLKSCDLDELKGKVEKIELLKGIDVPTPELIEKAKEMGIIDLGVSNQSLDDLYCVMRGAQGDLNAYSELGYMVDGSDFLIDSLFCEYAYIVNFDDNVLECYKGFNHDPKGCDFIVCWIDDVDEELKKKLPQIIDLRKALSDIYSKHIRL